VSLPYARHTSAFIMHGFRCRTSLMLPLNNCAPWGVAYCAQVSTVIRAACGVHPAAVTHSLRVPVLNGWQVSDGIPHSDCPQRSTAARAVWDSSVGHTTCRQARRTACAMEGTRDPSDRMLGRSTARLLYMLSNGDFPHTTSCHE
jgi:hypothetical protein